MNANRIVVFLGPSLDRAEAEAVLPATYLPPVSLGNVCDLVLDRDPPLAIGLVDGYFDQVPAVWHKEILYALSCGIPVFGAASMGAIRAAELHPFGMVGVGRIFEGFRAGRYQDADVAVLHGAAQDGRYRSLTVPMVNVVEGLAACVRAGVIEAGVANEIESAARAIVFPYRAREAVEDLILQHPLLDSGQRQAVVDAVLIDAKRVDVVELLEVLKRAAGDDSWVPHPPIAFEPTYLWEKLCRTIRNDRRGGPSTQAPDPGAPDPLLRILARREAVRVGLVPTESGEPREEAVLAALRERYRREWS